MLVYFLLATPAMNDDGFYYEGFAESLARGKLDFKSFYGFQGLSFFAAPIFWLTGSHNSIIIASIIFSLLSIPLAFLVGEAYHGMTEKRVLKGILSKVESSKDKFKIGTGTAGWYFLALFLLMPYPYTTMFRGFQESALLFFILLILYGSFRPGDERSASKIALLSGSKSQRDESGQKAGKETTSVPGRWTPIVWAIGGIVKPFALTLFPLFIKSFLNRKKIIWMMLALLIGSAYLGVNFYQTGHWVNNAAINSYQGNFDTGNPPPLGESFAPNIKGYLRVGANLLLSFRKVMISPLVIVLGALALWFNKNLKLRKEIILAIILNFILVGTLTFSFSKYLLPMTVLFALAAVPYLMKNWWLKVLVLIDSFFVFKPIFNHFGHNFWSSFYFYLLPLFLSAIIFMAFSKKINISSFLHDRVKRKILSCGRF